MLIAVAKIVLEVIALIFQRVERFIFNAPPRSRPLHDAVNCAFVDAQVSDPTEMLDFTLYRLPALDEVDPQIGIGLIERHVTNKAEPMVAPRSAVVTLIIGDPTGVLRFGHLREQKGMIAFFDAENIPHVLLV